MVGVMSSDKFNQIDTILQQIEAGEVGDDYDEDGGLLYDETPEIGGDSIYSLPINPQLEDWEYEEAEMLAAVTRGLMIVTGYPGAGKDLFGVTLAWKLRWYFGRRVGLDVRPRRLFDETVFPLGNRYFPFDEVVLFDEMRKTEQAARGIVEEDEQTEEGATVKKERKLSKTELNAMAANWAHNEGRIKLQNSVLHLQEFWRYMHNRRPMSPIGIAIGGIIKTHRHLDLLIIGTAPRKDELDEKACLKYVNFEARCHWAGDREDTTIANIYPTRFVSSKGVLETSGDPFHFIVDGGKPRPRLGDKRYFDLYVSKNQTSFGVARQRKRGAL